MTDQKGIQVRNIGKSFGATRALDNVSFDFKPGEIFAMVGANGAGKSTLIKIICGYYPDYEGEILIDGKPVRFSSPHDATSKGIATVHQIINQGVVQTMTVRENLALAELLSSEGGSVWYRPKQIDARAREIAEKMGLQGIDFDQEVSELEQSERQMIAIARALATDPKLLILDEPTSSISERETEFLFETLFRLKAMGVSILYVSHRLHEIERIADRVGVIRDGQFGGVLDRPFNVKQIVTTMVGELEQDIERHSPDISAQSVPKLEIRDLVVEKGQAPLNLKIFSGEIVGITGLIGAGKSELANVLFGLVAPVSGDILIDGVSIKNRSVSEAIENGIFMVPEDRANNAVVPDFSIRQNITLPFLKKFFSNPLGLLRHGFESREATRMVQSMGVKCESETTNIGDLSGGNQQKVVVARWLLTDFNLLILDEPFQGVDIRSRHDINAYIHANRGDRAILMLAADLDEVLEVADRVVVMNHGQIVGEQHITKIDREVLLHWTSQSPEDLKLQA
ncbi:sugar ABC transporter ATP-binding protein [Sneathiella aquimaris]|uniref:sugar ABC transporter ATP-binding protein n=1 Tax=Sneathiella aquimaris TaxID=2599305 RepID=UPI00146E8BFC|nr:sugar ABC transporter ATP-binding protein [Sneathiella aquimaris]